MDEIKGSLIVIGGKELRNVKEQEILGEITRRACEAKGTLLLMTVAARDPEEAEGRYRQALGHDVRALHIRVRYEAFEDAAVQQLSEAAVVLLIGGDQLGITSQISDSPVHRALIESYHAGATIAGTSAGAAAMGAIMLVAGGTDETTETGALGLAPGLNLLPDTIIDTHFAERGRIGRLLGAVAENPQNTGLGIDENTALIVNRGSQLRAIGKGGIYVVDGSNVTYSHLSGKNVRGLPSVFDVRLHLLANGDEYDLTQKRPLVPREERDTNERALPLQPVRM